MDRYGRGITLQVKIGSREECIGSVEESVLTRDASTRPVLGQPNSPHTQSPAPPGVVVATTTNNGLAIQNFINFVENSFEHALLIEQHLVKQQISAL